MNFIEMIRRLFLYAKLALCRYALSYFRIFEPKSNRDDGISICIRLNNDLYINNLFEQLMWIYDDIGEIIIHYNGLKDENVLFELCKEYKKIILKKYDLKQFDFVSYSNDFLKEIKYKWLFIFDSDIIFDKNILVKLIKKINRGKPNNIYYYSGLNLWKDENANIGFSNAKEINNSMGSIVGCGDFCCFIPKINKDGNSDAFKKGAIFIDTTYLRSKNVGISFIHLSTLFAPPIKTVDNYISKKTILKNMREIDTYCYKWYKKNFRHTSGKNLFKIIRMKERITL